jgi:hypothetical protein
LNYDKFADPEIQARISQYELAFRMQSEVPGLMDIEGEPDHVKELYGPQIDKPGSFARNCLLARRMAEKGVRYIQLFHRGGISTAPCHQRSASSARTSINRLPL